VPVPRQRNETKGDALSRVSPRFPAPQVGAQVALQQCPILRLGHPNATQSNISFPVTHHRTTRKEIDRIGQRTSSSPIRRNPRSKLCADFGPRALLDRGSSPTNQCHAVQTREYQSDPPSSTIEFVRCPMRSIFRRRDTWPENRKANPLTRALPYQLSRRSALSRRAAHLWASDPAINAS
jgi:hypothetical protein